MPKSQPSGSRNTQSRLGRGLGNLIPVPLQESPGKSQATPGAVPGRPAPGRPPRPIAEPADRATESSLPATPTATLAGPEADGREDVISFLPLTSLISGKYQPRGAIDPAGIQALATSIAKSGLMQPLVVRPALDRPAHFEVIAGERRWKALQHLGRTQAPAVIRPVGDQQAAELALVENLQREDLNPMDRAAALRRLVEEFGLTHQQVAEQVGMDRATVTNVIRLNELDSQTAALVRSGVLAAGHAKVLLGVSDPVRRVELAEASVRQDWSVRHLESAVKGGTEVPRGTSPKPASRTATSAHIAQLERQLEAHLGTRVTVRLARKKGAGELRVKFFSLDEFDGLMQRIGFRDGESRLIV